MDALTLVIAGVITFMAGDNYGRNTGPQGRTLEMIFAMFLMILGIALFGLGTLRAVLA